MSSTFCLWAPWVFSILAGIAAWLLRWAYDDKKFKEYEARIKTKEDDIFHLNEAHTLLLNDKEKKLLDLQGEVEIKERAIRELKHEVEQAETTNKSLLSQVVDQKKSKSSSLSRKDFLSANIATIPEDKMVGQNENDKEHEVEGINIKSRKKKKSKKKRYAKSISKKKNKTIRKLKLENKRLKEATSSEGKKTQKIVKEIPVSIYRTIIKREKIDKKKIKKYLKNLPIKKSKKVLKRKKIRGKSRILRSVQKD